MRVILLSFLLFVGLGISAQDVNIIPRPVDIKVSASKEPFVINKQTKLVFTKGDSVEKECKFLNDYLLRYYGFKLNTYDAKDFATAPNSIKFTIGSFPGKKSIQGSYSLEITKDQIEIIETYPNQGAFYAIQTLIQLLPSPDPHLKTQKQKLGLHDLAKVKDQFRPG